MLSWFTHHFLAPKSFYKTSWFLLPWLMGAFIIFFVYGLIAGLFIAPADYQQGDGFRIIYVHVPSAFTAMAIYLVMAICALLTLVWRIKIAAICMACSAEIGAWFTLLALVTGSIWGKPMWGTWWIWDARLTSVLILLFLYLGFIALRSVINDISNRDRASSIIALVGAINLPIIHYSVIWWNTLHQGPSLMQFAAPSIAPAMLHPLVSMIIAFLLFYAIILILRMQNEILIREIKTEWVKRVIAL
ncbi:MAG: heme transporter permease [Gammaproteobacteria bacterium]|jgi:heme exporter protein C|nr:heme transporter permease [Gammaproteobacteria bacterium]